MANGYIGKISAVVTANTSDLSRKLQGAVKDVDRFANSLNRSVSASAQQATASLEKIFTPLQRLERKLQTALRLNLRTAAEVREIQSLSQAAGQLNKPVERLQQGFSGLSLEIQSKFAPALRRAQDQAVAVNETITRTGAIAVQQFRAAEQAVSSTSTALQRLSELQKQASAGLTGRELQFSSPAALKALQDAAAASQRAGGLSPDALADGSIARQVQRLQTFRDAIARAAAEVEELRLRPNVDLTLLAAAEKRLNNIIATTTKAQQQLDRAVEISQNVGAATQIRSTVDPTGRSIEQRVQGQAAVRRAVEEEAAFRQRAADAAEREASAVERLSQSQNRLLAQEIQRNSGASARRNAAAFDAATAGVLNRKAPDAGVFERQTRTLESELQRTARLRQQFLALPEDVQQSLERERAALNNIGTAARDGAASLGLLAEANDRMAASIARANEELSEQARLARANASLTIAPDQPPPPSPSTPLGNRLAQQGADRIRRLTGNLNIDSTPVPGVFNEQAQRDIDALAGRVGQVRQQLETLPNSLRTQFIPALQQAQQQLIALQNAPGATADEIERARQAVDRLAQSASTTQRALDFRQRFGGGAGGFAQIFNDQALRGFTAQLEILQGVIGRVAADARGPLLTSFAQLRDVIFSAFRDGTLEAEGTQRRISALTQEVIRNVAAAGGGTRGGLARQVARAGDIGRAGFDKFGLAAQQAAFAIDDFFSVTGGLDQRIRAVGNNLTQLGFILGGTAGLFATVALVAGTQAVLGFVKYIRGGAESADIAKALNARLETQKRLVQEISAGFSDLAGDLADSAFSAAARQADALEKRITSLIAKLKEFGNATASALDPELFVLEGRRGTLERSLEGADSVPLAIARQARLRDAERQVRDARDRAAARNPIGRRELEDAINASYGSGVDTFRLPNDATDRQILDILNRRALELGQVVDSWFATFLTPFEQGEARRLISIVGDARQRLETGIADGVQRLAADAINTSGRRFSAAAGRAASLLEQARRGGGETDATRAAQAFGDADGRRVQQLFGQLGRAVAAQRQDEVQRIAEQIAALANSATAREREARAILDAANASARFVQVLDRFAELNESILGEITSAAEQARREAVGAAGTAAAGLSRPDDAQFAAGRSSRLAAELEAARDRRDEIERRRLEARRQFEQESPDPEVRRAVQEAARARALAESETASDFARAQARQRQVGADRRVDQVFAASPQGRRLQGEIDDADRQARAAIERDSLITRGRELSRSDAQRAGRELSDNIRAVNESFDDQVRQIQDRNPFADVDGIEEQRRAAIGRLRDESFRQQAPAIFGLADAVQNAILQGPSRAALEATDVSTVEGARELNRLLRGEDAARNQDLVELQKQSAALEELVQIAREQGVPGVAN